MNDLLIIFACALGFAVMGLLTRGLAHHDHDHDHGQEGHEPQDSSESCGGCSLHCETTEPSDV